MDRHTRKRELAENVKCNRFDKQRPKGKGRRDAERHRRHELHSALSQLTIAMNINPWDDDFCWCQFNPIYLGLGISLTLALFTGLVGVILLAVLSKKRFPLAKLYPGWAIVTGASSGVGRKV